MDILFQSIGAMEAESNCLYLLQTVGVLQVLRLSTWAILPSKQSTSANSYSIYSPRDFVVPAGRTSSISTDLCVSFKKRNKVFNFLLQVWHQGDPTLVGRIAPISHLLETAIIGGRNITTTFSTRSLCVFVYNISSSPLSIRAGEAFAQIVFPS